VNLYSKKINFIFLIISIISLFFLNYIAFIVLTPLTKNIIYSAYNLTILLFFYKIFMLVFFIFYKNIHWNSLFFYISLLLYVVF
jgi:hypothetical protein